MTIFFSTSAPDLTNNVTTLVDYCEKYYRNQYCYGKAYQEFCADWAFFDTFNDYFDIPTAFIALILSVLIILISLFGKIDGTFKWCIMNIGILHTLWPIFFRIAADMILTQLFRQPRSVETTRMLNGILSEGTD